MTQKTDTKKMSDELKAAADAAITMAKQQRGIASMATDPETHENAIKTAYHYVGVVQMHHSKYRCRETRKLHPPSIVY